jgi:hypothetical protein
VVWSLYRAGRELFEAGAAILGAFAHLLGVLVRTLPHVMLAGIIALGGVWVVNHLDNSWVVRMPSWLQASEQSSPPQSSPPQSSPAQSAPAQVSPPENHQSSPASGQKSGPPQDQRE